MLSFLSYSYVFGQHQKVKKATKITSNYDYTYFEDNKIYLSKKGKVNYDTSITEFDHNGKRISNEFNPNERIFKTITLDSSSVISETENEKHYRNFYSDTSVDDVFIYIFKDSIVKIKLVNGDTLQIEKIYNYKNVNKELKNFNNGFQRWIKIYEKANGNREVATIITTKYHGFTDTFRSEYYKRRNIIKKLVFNHDNGEWYEKEKMQFKKRRTIIWNTFYHDYHKKYFTTRKTVKFNKSGNPISEVTYDQYLKHVKTKVTYQYEYY